MAAQTFSGVPLLVIGALLMAAGCSGSAAETEPTPPPGPTPFSKDVDFLRMHTEVVVLTGADGAEVAIAPAYQGRVMTSTTGGEKAPSFGWIGRAAVESGRRDPHMNVFGGEDRFWLGPEGGQFALYFAPGVKFDLDHWQVPAAFDWDVWDVSSRSSSEVRFRKHMSLVNYSRTTLYVDVDRIVRVLDPDVAQKALAISAGASVRMVAFESENTVSNAGRGPWTEASGLVSVWILGQFNPTPSTTIVVPYAEGAPASLGPVVNDAYFGKVPANRLAVKPSAIFFRADGQYRAKIGLSPARALGIAGSYDSATHVLTIVQFTRPDPARPYVNSMWEIQKQPFKGDALNSYNDGPVAPGKPPLGPFYELETSSPALALAPGEHYSHVHRTFHLVGAEADLDRIARSVLKVGLADITGSFQK